MKKKIDLDEIVFPMFPADLVGRIFFYEERVFRAIYKDCSCYVLELLSSGLIADLVGQGLFPKTEITNFYLSEDYPLVIEHERIRTLSLPYEWSFEMLKDAALTTIKVNKIANKYQYRIHDCHAYNIMFENNKAIFVDFGSFVKYENNYCGLDYKIFNTQFKIPLKYWAKGYKNIARSIYLFRDYISEDEYLPLISRKFRIKLIMQIYLIINKINITNNEKIKIVCTNRILCFLLLIFKKYVLSLYYLRQDPENEILKLNYKPKKTQWSSYHDETRIEGVYRFEKIIEIINSFKDANSILEIGANQGKFAKYILKNTHLSHVIASDYDEIAVDIMYKSSKNLKGFQSLLFNFVRPDGRISDKEISERINSDIVVALAVTHHLLLSQGVKLEHLVEVLEKFTKKYLLIEFMPKGLGNNSHVPSYYTIDWFRNGLENKFRILYEEKLEDNRYLFAAILKDVIY